jgi:23S rRNA pseudouridine1911/1915/1917 synthase
VPLHSRTQAQRLIEEGAVTVKGITVKKASHRVWQGDTITVEDAAMKQEAESQLAPVDLHLKVLYEDAACMVIEKPVNVVVHPTIGVAKDTPTILHGAAFLFAERKIPFSEAGVLVHRLDRQTTGCLLLAKTIEAHAMLQKQFGSRTVQKTYLAIVAGVPSPAAATIDAPIGRHNTDRKKMAVFNAGKSRASKTTYTTLANSKDAALLACELHTGRTHQIRVHLSTVGHPVLGDETYANLKARSLDQKYGIRTVCLHAWKLTFNSPVSSKKVSVESPMPETMRAVLKKLEISYKNSDLNP